MAAVNLIVGFCTNMPVDCVTVFCRSIRRALPTADTEIVIVTNDPDTYAAGVRGLDVSFRLTPCDYKPIAPRSSRLFRRSATYATRWAAGGFLDRKLWDGTVARILTTLLESWCHPQIARWHAYGSVLKERPRIERVLFTDVKDVIVQDDCFSGLDRDCVQLFQEGMKLHDEKCNAGWVRDGFGQAALDSLKDVETICMGTALATRKAATSFLELLGAVFTRYPYRAVDQATITHMLHQLGDPDYLERVPNITGPVATLSSRWARDAVEIRDGYIVRRADGSVFPIVHMWDRWNDLNEAVFHEYGPPFTRPQAALLNP